MSGVELDYIVSSGAWSLGGLAIGYLLGRLHARLRGIERHLRHIDKGDDL